VNFRDLSANFILPSNAQFSMNEHYILGLTPLGMDILHEGVLNPGTKY